ncbi:metalloendoproteinase 2-mmp [Quercus suber]|uniref:Metalloendoproteinase 2-mmp n=1 Tax=Quercus suber TaxID=58331 RepID=A0AAW0IUG8_QUESU
MMMPRCGVADIINGTNWMRSENKKHDHNHGSFHTISHYAFFLGKPKWPASKYHLTYGFLPGIPAEAMNPIAQAFQTWATNTHFKFSQIENHTKADIKGAGGNLAHAIGPTNWGFHYDVDEQWSVGAAPGAFDLETVALHEIGHLLGLEHSEVQESIMWLIFSPGGTKDLHWDDINDIKALYNVLSIRNLLPKKS